MPCLTWLQKKALENMLHDSLSPLTVLSTLFFPDLATFILLYPPNQSLNLFSNQFFPFTLLLLSSIPSVLSHPSICFCVSVVSACTCASRYTQNFRFPT